jgi:pSer/pThr/pTyr-binding forkhead associated (FHA) protein
VRRRSGIPALPQAPPVPGENPTDPGQFAAFLANFRAAIIVLCGEGEGMEHVLDQPRVRIGRGPGVDLALDHPSLEREHALLEFDGAGYRVRLLREPNARSGAALKSEEQFDLGEIRFAYVLYPRTSPTS